MNFYSKISINFDCEVVEGGYSLQTSLINPAKSSSYFTNNYSLVQKIKKQKPRSKPFTVEALDDFIYLSKFLREDEFMELLIRFYNNWGPFIKLG